MTHYKQLHNLSLSLSPRPRFASSHSNLYCATRRQSQSAADIQSVLYGEGIDGKSPTGIDRRLRVDACHAACHAAHELKHSTLFVIHQLL